MLDGLVEWLKELTAFMVICETILSFAPSALYKRYIKPFVGLIMLLWITSYLFGAIEVDWDQRVDEVFEEYEKSVSQYLENVPIVNEADQENMNDNMHKDEKLNENIINIDKVIISSIKIGEPE